MVVSLAREMKGTTNLSMFSYNFLIFERCKTSQDNLIANIELSVVVTTLNFQLIAGEIYVNYIELCRKNDYLVSITVK